MECAKCKNTLNKDDPSLKCDSCDRTVHRREQCSSLNASELKVMDLKNKRTLRFYCEDCQQGLKLIPKLLAKIDNLEFVINEMKSKSQESPPISLINEETLINELNERQRRANNLMFFNLRENSQQTDQEQVKAIIKEMTNKELEVKKTVRVGKKNKNGASPLKVIFHNSDDVLLVMRNKKNIKKERQVFIELDMTPLQMMNLKKMKEEVNDRRKKGEDVFIRFVRGVPQVTKNLKK